jgi:hypothetical protein
MPKLNTLQKLAAIQREMKAPKSQYNSFGKYHYRSSEDILEALKPFEEKYNVTFTIDDSLVSVDTTSDLVFINACAIIHDHDSGETVEANAQALIDFQAKGMQMPQRTGAASSYAKKYALGNLLLLDDTKDPDATNTHGKGVAPAIPKSPPKPSKKVMSESEKLKFLKAIGEGKFASVEKYLSKYADDKRKKDVNTALNNTKSGK